MFVLKRLLFVILVVWSASTITFFIPRISDINPIRERFAELARLGGFSAGELETIVASYSKAFGLDKPLMQQYFDYIGGVMTLDFGVSLNKFPKTVLMLIAESLPWTIGLILVTTILSFVIGNLVGALAAWPLSPRWRRQRIYRLLFPKSCLHAQAYSLVVSHSNFMFCLTEHL